MRIKLPSMHINFSKTTPSFLEKWRQVFFRLKMFFFLILFKPLMHEVFIHFPFCHGFLLKKWSSDYPTVLAWQVWIDPLDNVDNATQRHTDKAQ